MSDLFPVPDFTSFMDVFPYVSNVTGGLFGNMLMLGLFLVTFIGLKRYGTEQSLLAASMFCFIVSLMGWGIGFIEAGTVIIFVGLVVISFIIGYKEMD